MQNSVKSKAEQQFAATQKKADQALSDREKARRKEAEHTASLRALRLAKEAADREAAALAEAEKAAAKQAVKPAAKKTGKPAAKKKQPAAAQAR